MITPTDGLVGFSISEAQWALILDTDYDANNQLSWWYDAQEQDELATTNKYGLGKGKFLSEIKFTA